MLDLKGLRHPETSDLLRINILQIEQCLSIYQNILYKLLRISSNEIKIPIFCIST